MPSWCSSDISISALAGPDGDKPNVNKYRGSGKEASCFSTESADDAAPLDCVAFSVGGAERLESGSSAVENSCDRPSNDSSACITSDERLVDGQLSSTFEFGRPSAVMSTNRKRTEHNRPAADSSVFFGLSVDGAQNDAPRDEKWAPSAPRAAPCAKASMQEAEAEARANGGTFMRKFRHPYNAGQHNKSSIRSKNPRGLAPLPSDRVPTSKYCSDSLFERFVVWLPIGILSSLLLLGAWRHMNADHWHVM